MSNKKSINTSAEQDAKPNKNVAKKEIVKEDPSVYERFSKIELD